MKRLFLLAITFLIGCGGAVLAHSIYFETGQHAPAVTVKAFFSRTAPLVNASVEVFSPGETRPYQRGWTDRTGTFAFIPDSPGNWTFTVDDGMGHAGRVTVAVPADFFEHGDIAALQEGDEKLMVTEIVMEHGHSHGPEQSVVYRIIFGIALIIGVTGFTYALKAKQELNRKNSGR
jgi:hypothetical protein